MGRSVIGLFILVSGAITLLSSCGNNKDETPYAWKIPYDLPEPKLPDDKVITAAQVKLGRHLFYDMNLSGNQTTACASCHQQGFAFAERRQKSQGAEGDTLQRNALALVNVAYQSSFTWAHNGLPSIEAQLHLPLFNEFPIEMGVTGNEAQILERLSTKDYQQMFEKAFGDPTPSLPKIVESLASFVSTLISLNSPFDRYAYNNDDEAMSEQAVKGLNLFFSERMECFHCHGGLNFTQSSQHASQRFQLRAFHNTGLGLNDNDLGLFNVTRNEDDKGRFRAPTLRNIALTAPYMHDGSIETLVEVLDFYAQGGRGQGMHDKNKSVFVSGFSMTKEEKEALLAFLHSLTDKGFVTNQNHAAPFAVPDSALN